MGITLAVRNDFHVVEPCRAVGREGQIPGGDVWRAVDALS